MQYQNNVQFTNSKESILSYLSIPNKKNLENKKITDGSKNSWNWYFLPTFFWPTVRKKCFNDREKIWNSRLKISRKFFLTCSWRFLRSNSLEPLEFKLEKMGIKNLQEKLENNRNNESPGNESPLGNKSLGTNSSRDQTSRNKSLEIKGPGNESPSAKEGGQSNLPLCPP